MSKRLMKERTEKKAELHQFHYAPSFCLTCRHHFHSQERAKLEKEPLDFVTGIENGSSLFEWDVHLTGPPESPYAGGTFVLRMDFPQEYPFKPPKLSFKTKVYHPSVELESGQVCGAVLGQWGPTQTATHCLEVVYSLLQAPSPDHPLEDEIAQQLATKPKEFEKMAKKYTKDYAK